MWYHAFSSRFRDDVSVVGINKQIVQEFASFAAAIGDSVRSLRSSLHKNPGKNGLTFLRFSHACEAHLDSFTAIVAERSKTAQNLVVFRDNLLPFISPIKLLEEVQLISC